MPKLTLRPEIVKNPKRLRSKIEHRRWWNQICIDSLSNGTYTGCCRVDNVNCHQFLNCGYILCQKCDLDFEMRTFPESSFIGFIPFSKKTIFKFRKHKVRDDIKYEKDRNNEHDDDIFNDLQRIKISNFNMSIPKF